jgi:hypothetical protein
MPRRGGSTEICLKSTIALWKDDFKFPTGTRFTFATLMFAAERDGELVL